MKLLKQKTIKGKTSCIGGCGRMGYFSRDLCKECQKIKCKRCSKPFYKKYEGNVFCKACRERISNCRDIYSETAFHGVLV